MPEIFNCELWEKAKNLAQDRGFHMSPSCPVVQNCTGEHCVFLKTDEEKLDELREELGQIQNASYDGVKVVELGC
jgi:hypothetical protein